MSTDPYTLMLIGLGKTGRRTPKKEKLPKRPNSFPLRPKHFRSVSTGISLKPKSVKSHRFSYPMRAPITGEKSMDVVDTKACMADVSNHSPAYTKVLSLQSFSSGHASIFKLRNAGPRILLYGTSPYSELSKINFTKKNNSSSSLNSLPSVPNKIKGDCNTSGSNDEECILLEQVNSSDSEGLMSSVVELPRSGSPSLRKVEIQHGDYRCFSSGHESSHSSISDWRDCFMCSNADVEIERIHDELTIASNSSWESSLDSQQKIPSFQTPRFKFNEQDIPPSGMVCVAWINTRTGNRFINLPLTTKLERVLDWLGSSLPIVIEEDGKRGRLCDSNTTLGQTVGKGLDPSKDGLGFFIGPVNGTVSYILKVCDLHRLYALRPTEAEEEEKLVSVF